MNARKSRVYARKKICSFIYKKHSQRRSEKGKIALIVVAAIAAKKIFATISAKCASAWFCLFHCNWKNVFSCVNPARKSILVVLIFFIQHAFLNAETFVGKRMLTFDLSYLSTGLKYNGYGLGAKYEIQCFDFFSIRPGISHMVLFPKESETVCITVGVKVGIFFYPFFKGLEGFYIGSDFATDFCMFRGKSYENNESAITASPILGWKFSVLEYVFFDVFCGYQFLLNKGTFSHESLTNYYGNKFVYGLKMKLNLKKICLSISDTAKKNAAKRAAKKTSSIPQTEAIQPAPPVSPVDEQTEETQTTSSSFSEDIQTENSQNTINSD